MISEELYRRYKRALDVNDEMARNELMEFIRAIVDMTSDEDAVRDALLDGFPALVQKYGNRAGEVAAEFYKAQRAASLGAAAVDFAVTVAESAAVEKLTADVRYAVGPMYAGNIGTMESNLAGMLTRRVYQQADQTLMYGMKRDPAKPHACLVPAPGACAWCQLIAANGWDLTRKHVEAMRHHDCRCTLVVDFKDPQLKGYDHSKYQRVYEEANTYENQNRWREEWYSLPDSEKEKYDDWSHFSRNKLVQAMRGIED